MLFYRNTLSDYYHWEKYKTHPVVMLERIHLSCRNAAMYPLAGQREAARLETEDQKNVRTGSRALYTLPNSNL